MCVCVCICVSVHVCVRVSWTHLVQGGSLQDLVLLPGLQLVQVLVCDEHGPVRTLVEPVHLRTAPPTHTSFNTRYQLTNLRAIKGPMTCKQVRLAVTKLAPYDITSGRVHLDV